MAAAAPASTIRVLLADDHRLFAEALGALLGMDDRIAVVGRASDGREAVALAAELRPDVVLMDLHMPLLDGIAAVRAIRAERSDACVLMLTSSDARADVDRAREAGAAGYITKDRVAAELIAAIVEIAGR
jgi:DNA-binding NarL/FixJ family response regulator